MGSKHVPTSVFISLPIIVKEVALLYAKASPSAMLWVSSSVFYLMYFQLCTSTSSSYFYPKILKKLKNNLP